jgi:secondary thiamine-phosphate synthase enzyme
VTAAQHCLTVATPGQGLYEVTREIAAWVAAQGVATGLLTVFIRHTSASLLVQENASPAVRDDLTAFLRRLVPEEPGRYAHDDEGPDDMPSHIRAALTQTHLAIPVADGRLVLGTWQGIFVFEHRHAPHRRELVLHLAGDEFRRAHGTY